MGSGSKQSYTYTGVLLIVRQCQVAVRAPYSWHQPIPYHHITLNTTLMLDCHDSDSGASLFPRMNLPDFY